MNNWLKIIINLDEVLIEPVSDFLIGVIGAGTEVKAEQHIQHKTLNAYYEKQNPSRDDIELILNRVETHCSELASIFEVLAPQIQWEILEDQDWGRIWKDHFSPIAITKNLIISPSWEQYQSKRREKVIIMDPGMAFGTGHHATTELVLQLMEDVIFSHDGFDSALDVGTGTGILGIAAALFGVKKVHGIDNDPVAVEVAAENVKKNSLTDVMSVGREDVTKIEGENSLVVANIVHDVLLGMARDLTRLTADHGWLILSGILKGEQEISIIEEYEKHGFSSITQKYKEEWVALLFHLK